MQTCPCRDAGDSYSEARGGHQTFCSPTPLYSPLWHGLSLNLELGSQAASLCLCPLQCWVSGVCSHIYSFVIWVQTPQRCSHWVFSSVLTLLSPWTLGLFALTSHSQGRSYLYSLSEQLWGLSCMNHASTLPWSFYIIWTYLSHMDIFWRELFMVCFPPTNIC